MSSSKISIVLAASALLVCVLFATSRPSGQQSRAREGRAENDSAADGVMSGSSYVVRQDLPIWPNGAAKVAGGILEVMSDHGICVFTRDIIEISMLPPSAGRLCFTLRYRAGLRKHETSYWIELRHEAALRELVTAIEAAQQEG